MKKITFFIAVFFILTQITNAQISSKAKNGTAVKATYTYHQPSNCSPYTALLMADLKQNKSAQQLIEKYSLVERKDGVFVSSFIVVANKFEELKFRDLNIQINSTVGNINTAMIPLENLERLFSIEGVEYVEIGQKVELKLDQARTKTWVNEVHNGTGLSQSYTGDGVIVGVIDGGFDYTHPTFYNSDFTQYRISRVWEQDQSGTPPGGFGYGNELIGYEALVNDGYSSTGSSHGTHVTGIAAGSGSILPVFKGVAYESEIVLSTYAGLNPNIANAIAYIFNYASSVGKPAVINMSLGIHIGPHDGTSIFDQFCDGSVGDGKIIVGAAGNEGADKLHFDYDLGSDETAFSFIEFPHNSNNSSGATFIDIWGEAGKDFTIAINIYNIEDGAYQGYTDYVSSATDGTFNFTIQDPDPSNSDVCTVSIAVEHSNSQNSKPHMYVTVDNTDQNEAGDINDYVLLEVKGTNTSFNAWCSNAGSAVFSNKGNSSVTDGNKNVTVGEIGGTGKSIITVGAFTSKNSYTDYQGNNHNIGHYTSVGEIAPFSSLGPTVDGRTKPDVSAPGNEVVSSVNSFDPNYNGNNPSVIGEVHTESKYWWFAAMPGTSMASPMVTGIIALWLENSPDLNPNDIKQYMLENSWTDTFTGSIPNNTWGSGKIDAQKTMKAIENSFGIESIHNNDIVSIFPNPSNGKFTLKLKDETIKNIQIFDITGKLVYSEQIINNETQKEINLSNMTSGIYLLKLTGDKYTLQSKLMLN